mmetsp:Transcript_1103/g.2684  ORF Transcript_1103/g.2684 Transcript_1103/m.2684 type:complete len:212 (-) Transcript_1103:278-913(-)
MHRGHLVRGGQRGYPRAHHGLRPVLSLRQIDPPRLGVPPGRVDVGPGHLVEQEHGEQSGVARPTVVPLREDVPVHHLRGEVGRESQSAPVGVVIRKGGDELIVLSEGFGGDQAQAQVALLKIIIVVVIVIARDDAHAGVERPQDVRSVRIEGVVRDLGKSFQSLLVAQRRGRGGGCGRRREDVVRRRRRRRCAAASDCGEGTTTPRISIGA